MKIMIVSSEYSSKDSGGIGIYLHNLCKHLVLNGHEVSLITSSSCDLESEDLMKKLTIFRIPYLDFPLIGMMKWSISASILSRKLIKQYEYDIVNPHLPSSHFFTIFYGQRVPLVLTVHNSFLNRGVRNVNLISKNITKIRDVFSSRKSDGVICLNTELKLMLAKYSKNQHIYAVPLGFDENEFQLIQKEKTKNKVFTVLYVGRIVEGKGLEYLLEAIDILNNESIKLMIVGTGYLKCDLEEKYKHLRNVFFLGRIDNRQDIASIYSNSDLFVIPSEGEGMPTVLIEAMASGLPIVATKLPGIEEVVTDKFCRLVEPGNALEIATAIKELTEDEALLELMSQESFNSAKRYTWSTISQEILSIFNRMA